MKKILSFLVILMIVFMIPTLSHAELYYDSANPGYTYDYYDDIDYYYDSNYDDEYYDDYYYDDYEDEYYEDDMPMAAVLFMEAFVTIHMSVFVLWPFAHLIEKENPKKMFWFFFISRIVILMYCNFFVSTMICIVDFFAVFIGAFIVVPVTASIQAGREKRELKKLKREISPEGFLRRHGIDINNSNATYTVTRTTTTKKYGPDGFETNTTVDSFDSNDDLNDDPIQRY